MKKLKRSDELLTKCTGAPDVRFVERAGRTVIDLLGRSNPWAAEQGCQRHSCLPCWSKYWLTEEADRQPIVQPGEYLIPTPSKEDTVALSGCTVESICYTLECTTCRQQGSRRQYQGESSHSAYQRGIEHGKGISSGVLTHPLVLHFWEEHSGVEQPVRMRITSKHQSPLERQVRESVNIDFSSRKEK